MKIKITKIPTCRCIAENSEDYMRTIVRLHQDERKVYKLRRVVSIITMGVVFHGLLHLHPMCGQLDSVTFTEE